MHPFLAQYLPTEKSRNSDNQSMKDSKAEGFRKGEKWMSKYLFHIPLLQGFRRSTDKKIKQRNEEDRLNISEQVTGEEEETAEHLL